MASPDGPNASSSEDLGDEARLPHPTVVGIGASAGGLAALKELFAHVPPDTGLAYVVVVHLSPGHESHLADLLQSHMEIPVQQVTETVPLESNHVYVIPPNANLDAIDTHLHLTDLETKREERAPIDHFLRTLARTHEGHAVGVILTGTGSDGALGLREVKEKGGLTVVQDPQEAEYGGMPRSAMATGAVDLVLPLAEIPAAVLRYVRTEPRMPLPEDDEVGEEGGGALLQKILTVLLGRSRRDFSRYKRSTVVRRIRHRMQLHQVEEMTEYLRLLKERKEEATALADELLITVTRFFRDQSVFDALERDVVPSLFDRKGPQDQIRIWSVGCATGEEPYSLAMLLLEEARRREAAPELQVFASDLHEESLARARAGHYPGDIESDVTRERLQRFFQEKQDGYRILNEVRDLVVFSSHDLLRDPPFSRLDMILCRNVLIYLRRDAQEEIVEVFHYALQPGGLLVLGTAETVADSKLFRATDEERAVYQRQDVAAREKRLPVFSRIRRPRSAPADREEWSHERGGHGVLHQRLVERLAPPSLLVNARDEVVHLSERAHRYLIYPGGEPTTQVTNVFREELRTEFGAALREARASGDPVRTRSVRVQFEDGPRSVALDVRPSRDPAEEGFVLVVFDERAHPDGELAGPGSVTPDGPPDEDESGGRDQAARVDELDEELRNTRQRLRTVIEQYETSREEMSASNEELQSMNEELRSTMEELETSKEELQSMNEELQTVNQENRHKVEELAQLTGDLQNLLQATDIATLFLDRQLRILRFTPQVSRLFNIQQSDGGRPISDLTNRLGYDELTSDAERVLDRLTPIEREVRDREGEWYLTRVMPYRSADDRIEGVVLTFVDITSRKTMEEELREAKSFAESIVETLHEPLLVLTQDLTVKSANQAFYDDFRLDPGATLDRLVYDIGDGALDIPEVRAFLEDVLTEPLISHEREVEHKFDGLGERILILNGHRLEGVDRILLGIRDITDQKRLERRIRQKHKMEAVGRLAGGIGHDFNNLLTIIEGQAALLLDAVADDSPLRDDLEGIRNAGRRAAALVQQLLAFSREQILNTRKVSLGLAAFELEDVLRRLIPEGVELAMERADQADPVVHADPGQLQQILLNLVVNAAEAIEGPGTITVEIDVIDLSPKEARAFSWQVEPGPYARLTVRDTGRGMAPEEVDQIFDPFFTTKKDRSGSGLGLATVYGIVKQSRGHILVDSVPGRGTTFRVLLPRQAGSADDDGETAIEPGEHHGSARDQVVVLLVEDNGPVRRTIRRLLERTGYTVLEAGNGREALKLLGENEKVVDLILSDVVMPEVDGIELTRQVAADRPGLPVLLMSGHAQADQRNEGPELAAGFLSKPVTQDDLFQAITDILRTSPGRR